MGEELKTSNDIFVDEDLTVEGKMCSFNSNDEKVLCSLCNDDTRRVRSVD